MGSITNKVSNFLAATIGWQLPRTMSKKLDAGHISRYIAPVAFERLRLDIQSWKDAYREAETPLYPYRVKQQQIYMNLVTHGYVAACLERRRNLILLKDFAIYDGDKVDEKATELIKANWFYDLLGNTLDAKFYGYTLIETGPLVNNEFNEMNIVRREMISPDRLVVSNMIYNPAGLEFNNPEVKDDNGESFYDWTLWITTPSERGSNLSPCGYGLLAKVALYDIFLTNLLSFNADYVELFAQPFRVGKTNKQEGVAFDEFVKAMTDIGSSGYAIIDPMDEIEFKDASAGGNGYKSYGEFEKRLENKICALILGHEDALSGTPGKLGSQQGAKESPVRKALDDIEKLDSRWLEFQLNNNILPKLKNIGLPIPDGRKFKFKNDKEVAMIREQNNINAKEVSDYVKILSDAGYKADVKWVSEQTGIPLTEAAPPVSEEKIISDKYEKINNLYNG